MYGKMTLFILSGAAALTFLLSGCYSASADYASVTTENAAEDTDDTSDMLTFESVCKITLGEEVSVSGEGAWYDEGVLYLSKGGVYSVSGVIGDGCIYIDAEEKVKLLLNGLSVTNSKGAAIYCRSAKELCVELVVGTENTLTDGSSCSFEGTEEYAEEDEPDAAFYSKSDVVICGSGSLAVNGNYKDGIRGAHDMCINGGFICINAAGDGIDSNGNITINGGTVLVNGSVSGDQGGSVTVNGGTLVAVGSLQTAENPSADSAQNSICAQLSLDPGDTFALLDEGGNNIVVFTVEKQAQHIVISSPDIKTGGTYSLHTGVSVSGDSRGGLYDNSAQVTTGESGVTVTVESAVTACGNTGGFGGQ